MDALAPVFASRRHPLGIAERGGHADRARAARTRGGRRYRRIPRGALECAHAPATTTSATTGGHAPHGSGVPPCRPRPLFRQHASGRDRGTGRQHDDPRLASHRRDVLRMADERRHLGRVAGVRFYIPPAMGDSHFYSASPAECDEVRIRFPQFTYESAQVMAVALPDVATGACPAFDAADLSALEHARGFQPSLRRNALHPRRDDREGLRSRRLWPGWRGFLRATLSVGWCVLTYTLGTQSGHVSLDASSVPADERRPVSWRFP
jgi:hypothetical protein